MLRSKGVLFCALLSLVLIPTLGCPSRPAEPARPESGPRRLSKEGKTAIERLGSADGEVRRAAVETLASDWSPEATAAIVARLGDTHPPVVQAAERVLVARGQAVVESLVAALGPATDAAALRISAVLVKIGAPAAPLLGRQLTGTDERLATRSAAALGALGPAAMSAVVDVLQAKDPTARRRAVAVAALVKDSAAIEPLLQGLHDGDEQVKAAAVAALRERRDPALVARMLTALGTWQMHKLSGLVWVLHDSGDAQVEAALMKKFGDKVSTFDRHGLLSILVSLDGKWYEKLVAGLGSPDAAIRAGLLNALRYEATSLERIKIAGANLGDAALEKWASGELAKLLAAVRTAAGKAAFAALAKAPDDEDRYAAAQVLSAAGEQTVLAAAERAYVAALRKRLTAVTKLPPPSKIGQRLTAPPDERVVLWGRLGEVLWRQSCPVPEVNGVCLTAKVVKGVRTTQIVARRAPLVKQAKDAFAAALKEWNGGKVVEAVPADAADRIARVARARHYAAWATFMQAEMDLESFMKPDLPKSLLNARTTQQVIAANQDVTTWIQGKLKVAERLTTQYDAVVTRVKAAAHARGQGSVFWSIASVTRVAQLFETFARQLVEVPTPPLLRDPGAVKAFREQMDGFVKPLRSRAAEVFQKCLTTSSSLTRFWEWAIICQAGFVRADARTYHEWQQKNPWRGFRAPLATGN
jgi:hypothetical protein